MHQIWTQPVFCLVAYKCIYDIRPCCVVFTIWVNTVPFIAVSITVAVIFGVHAAILQTAATVLAAWWSAAPVSVHLAHTRASYPPAKWRALCNTHITYIKWLMMRKNLNNQTDLQITASTHDAASDSHFNRCLMEEAGGDGLQICSSPAKVGLMQWAQSRTKMQSFPRRAPN